MFAIGHKRTASLICRFVLLGDLFPGVLPFGYDAHLGTVMHLIQKSEHLPTFLK